MATATLKMLYCVQAATGTDSGVNNALAAALPPAFLPGQLGANPGVAIGNLLQAIDVARADPDDLYVTTGTAGGRDNAVWPGRGQNSVMRSGQSQPLNLQIPFAGSLNVSLWDYDSGSRDDLLGSVTILESDFGQGDLAKIAASPVEGSVYYVVYNVN
jgi:hypothetical protein